MFGEYRRSRPASPAAFGAPTSRPRSPAPTYNSKGYRTTSAGIPGSGLSYRATKRVGAPVHGTTAQPRSQSGADIVVNLLKAIGKLIFFCIIGCVITQVLTGHWWIFVVVVVVVGAGATLMQLRSRRWHAGHECCLGTHRVAVDTAGNLSVTDYDNNNVLKLPAGPILQ
jgi:hypothetical protein